MEQVGARMQLAMAQMTDTQLYKLRRHVRAEEQRCHDIDSVAVAAAAPDPAGPPADAEDCSDDEGEDGPPRFAAARDVWDAGDGSGDDEEVQRQLPVFPPNLHQPAAPLWSDSDDEEQEIEPVVNRDVPAAAAACGRRRKASVENGPKRLLSRNGRKLKPSVRLSS
jgi:hypothetical protein